MRKDVEKYIQKKYSSGPEHLWRSYPNYSVFRHADNRKWFAIVMDVDSDKIGRPGTERVDIIDVKIDDLMLRDILLQQGGFYPGYHMNKRNWITIVLDGTVSFDEICRQIDASFELTASVRQKRYKPDKFTFEVLKNEYGITAIRGPRGITNSLSAALK